MKFDVQADETYSNTKGRSIQFSNILQNRCTLIVRETCILKLKVVCCIFLHIQIKSLVYLFLDHCLAVVVW